jgi:hypothetical protein
MRLIVLSLIALAATAAAAPADRPRETDEQRLAKRLAGWTAQPATDCLSPTLTRDAGTEVYGRTLLYRTGPGVVYRNDTTGGCEALANDSYIVTKSYGGRLCRGDIAQTIDRGSRAFTGSCALGGFIRYSRP